MFNLESLGKIHVSKENTKNVCTFPHAFTFSSSLMFLESGWTFYIIHPSFTWSSQEAKPSWVFILHVFSFSSLSMSSPSSGSHWNVLVHSDHSLFHFVHEHCVFVLFVEPCFVLVCSPVVTIPNCIKVQGLLCCWMNEQWRSLDFMRKSGHLSFPHYCCAMVSSITKWVEACLLCWHCGLLCVHILPWYELVWSGIGSELAW